MTNRLSIRTLLAVALSLTSGLVFALTPYQAEYRLSWDVGIKLSGTATQRLSPENDMWRLEQSASASLGSLNETSLFRQDSSGRILPLEFVRKTQILGRGKEQQYRFNWNQRQVQMDDETLLDLQDGVFDPLTLQLALRESLTRGELIQVRLADRGRIREYPFENLGLQSIATPNGTIEAIQLRYRKNENSHTDMWFDPAREHLMVALSAIRDGKSFQLQLTEATFSPMDATTANRQ